eukprot:1159521-Pelagomonas_calceolata.AAC.8
MPAGVVAWDALCSEEASPNSRMNLKDASLVWATSTFCRQAFLLKLLQQQSGMAGHALKQGNAGSLTGKKAGSEAAEECVYACQEHSKNKTKAPHTICEAQQLQRPVAGAQQSGKKKRGSLQLGTLPPPCPQTDWSLHMPHTAKGPQLMV